MHLCLTNSGLVCRPDGYDIVSWCNGGRYLLPTQEMDPHIQAKEGKGVVEQQNWSVWMCFPLFYKIMVDRTRDHDFSNVTSNGCIGGRFLPPTQGIILPIHRDEEKRLDLQQNLSIGMWSMYLCFTFSELACCQDAYDTFSWWRRGRYLLLARETDPHIQTKEGKRVTVWWNSLMWMCSSSS